MIKIQSNKPDELVFICSNEDEKEFIKNNSEKILDEFVQGRTRNHWKSFKDYQYSMVYANLEAEKWGTSIQNEIEWNNYWARGGMDWIKGNIELLENFINQRYLSKINEKTLS